MGQHERPIPEQLGDQTEQARHLTRTGNGPTVGNEAELLAERYGAPDMAGVFSGREVAEQPADADQDDDQGAAEAAQDGGEA